MKSDRNTPFNFFHAPSLLLSILIIFAGFGMFARLSVSELQPLGSAVHAAVSREILRTNDWLTLHWPGNKEFEDFYQFPPLFFWLQAMTFKIFGVSDWSAKLVSSFFGFLTIILIYFLARVVTNGDDYAGFLSAMTTVLFPYFFKHSRKCELETILIFFIALGFLFFIFSIRKNDPRWLVPAGLSCGLGLLSKGPPALALWGAVFIYYLFEGDIAKKISNIYLWLGIAATIIVPLLWVIPQIIYKGDALYQKYIVNQILWSIEGRSKVVVGIWQKLGGYLFFFGAFFTYYLPWSVVGIFGVIKIFKEKLKLFYILIIWVAVVWAGFTAAGYKDDYYLLAFWPAWSVITGFILSRWTKNIKQQVIFSSGILAVVFALAVVFLPVKFDRVRNPEFVKLGPIIEKSVPEGKEVIVYKMFYYDASGLLAWYASRGAYSMINSSIPQDAKAWRLRSPDTPEEIERIFSSGESNFIIIKNTDYQTLPPELKKKINIIAEEGQFIFGQAA